MSNNTLTHTQFRVFLGFKEIEFNSLRVTPTYCEFMSPLEFTTSNVEKIPVEVWYTNNYETTYKLLFSGVTTKVDSVRDKGQTLYSKIQCIQSTYYVLNNTQLNVLSFDKGTDSVASDILSRNMSSSLTAPKDDLTIKSWLLKDDVKTPFSISDKMIKTAMHYDADAVSGKLYSASKGSKITSISLNILLNGNNDSTLSKLNGLDYLLYKKELSGAYGLYFDLLTYINEKCSTDYTALAKDLNDLIINLVQKANNYIIDVRDRVNNGLLNYNNYMSIEYAQVEAMSKKMEEFYTQKLLPIFKALDDQYKNETETIVSFLLEFLFPKRYPSDRNETPGNSIFSQLNGFYFKTINNYTQYKSASFGLAYLYYLTGNSVVTNTDTAYGKLIELYTVQGNQISLFNVELLTAGTLASEIDSVLTKAGITSVTSKIETDKINKIQLSENTVFVDSDSLNDIYTAIVDSDYIFSFLNQRNTWVNTLQKFSLISYKYVFDILYNESIATVGSVIESSSFNKSNTGVVTLDYWRHGVVDSIGDGYSIHGISDSSVEKVMIKTKRKIGEQLVLRQVSKLSDSRTLGELLQKFYESYYHNLVYTFPVSQGTNTYTCIIDRKLSNSVYPLARYHRLIPQAFTIDYKRKINIKDFNFIFRVYDRLLTNIMNSQSPLIYSYKDDEFKDYSELDSLFSVSSRYYKSPTVVDIQVDKSAAESLSEEYESAKITESQSITNDIQEQNKFDPIGNFKDKVYSLAISRFSQDINNIPPFSINQTTQDEATLKMIEFYTGVFNEYETAYSVTLVQANRSALVLISLVESGKLADIYNGKWSDPGVNLFPETLKNENFKKNYESVFGYIKKIQVEIKAKPATFVSTIMNTDKLAFINLLIPAIDSNLTSSEKTNNSAARRDDLYRIILAQLALESEWGKSNYAKKFNNYSGLLQTSNEPYEFNSVDEFTKNYLNRLRGIGITGTILSSGNGLQRTISKLDSSGVNAAVETFVDYLKESKYIVAVDEAAYAKLNDVVNSIDLSAYAGNITFNKSIKSVPPVSGVAEISSFSAKLLSSDRVTADQAVWYAKIKDIYFVNPVNPAQSPTTESSVDLFPYQDTDGFYTLKNFVKSISSIDIPILLGWYDDVNSPNTYKSYLTRPNTSVVIKVSFRNNDAKRPLFTMTKVNTGTDIIMLFPGRKSKQEFGILYNEALSTVGAIPTATVNNIVEVVKKSIKYMCVANASIAAADKSYTLLESISSAKYRPVTVDIGSNTFVAQALDGNSADLEETILDEIESTISTMEYNRSQASVWDPYKRLNYISSLLFSARAVTGIDISIIDAIQSVVSEVANASNLVTEKSFNTNVILPVLMTGENTTVTNFSFTRKVNVSNNKAKEILIPNIATPKFESSTMPVPTMIELANVVRDRRRTDVQKGIPVSTSSVAASLSQFTILSDRAQFKGALYDSLVSPITLPVVKVFLYFYDKWKSNNTILTIVDFTTWVKDNTDIQNDMIVNWSSSARSTGSGIRSDTSSVGATWSPHKYGMAIDVPYRIITKKSISLTRKQAEALAGFIGTNKNAFYTIIKNELLGNADLQNLITQTILGFEVATAHIHIDIAGSGAYSTYAGFYSGASV